MAQWNLRRQLEEAAAQRRLAAGLSATADDALMERPIVVDLTETTPAAPQITPQSTPPRTPAPPRDSIDLREPLAPWHDPSDAAPPARAERSTEQAWTANSLAPRRAAAITLPLWQGSSGPGPAAMVREHAPSETAPPPARAASTAASNELPADTDRVATRQPTKDRCPHCNGKVRLDRFDLVDAVAHMSCTDCGFHYQAKSPKL